MGFQGELKTVKDAKFLVDAIAPRDEGNCKLIVLIIQALFSGGDRVNPNQQSSLISLTSLCRCEKEIPSAPVTDTIHQLEDETFNSKILSALQT